MSNQEVLIIFNNCLSEYTINGADIDPVTVQDIEYFELTGQETPEDVMLLAQNYAIALAKMERQFEHHKNALQINLLGLYRDYNKKTS